MQVMLEKLKNCVKNYQKKYKILYKNQTIKKKSIITFL